MSPLGPTAVQLLNAAARVIFSAWKYDRIMPLFQQIHWLRASQRIEYKLAVLVDRCLHGLAPSYLAEAPSYLAKSLLLRVADVDSRRRLRSASTSALIVPTTRLAVDDRAFYDNSQLPIHARLLLEF